MLNPARLDPHFQNALSTNESFRELLTTCAALCRNVSSSDVSFPGSATIQGVGRPGLPPGVLYIGPREQSHEQLFTELRQTILRLESRLDQANLLYLGIQFIHPLDDGNGRVGRFLREAMLGKHTIDPRFLPDSIAACPYAVEGTTEGFRSEVVNIGYAVYALGRFGNFAASFGPEQSLCFAGVHTPAFDQLEMSAKYQAIWPALATLIRPHTSIEASPLALDLLAHVWGSQNGDSPLKIALLETLVPSRRIEPSEVVKVIQHPELGKYVDLVDIPGVLNRMSRPELEQLISRSWELTDQRVHYLFDCFEYPENHIKMTNTAGQPCFLKDKFRA